MAFGRQVTAEAMNFQVSGPEMTFEAVRLDEFTRDACAVREEKRTKD